MRKWSVVCERILYFEHPSRECFEISDVQRTLKEAFIKDSPAPDVSSDVHRPTPTLYFTKNANLEHKLRSSVTDGHFYSSTVSFSRLLFFNLCLSIILGHGGSLR